MYSQALRAEIDAACKDFATLTVPCLKALSKMETQIGNFDGTLLSGYSCRTFCIRTAVRVCVSRVCRY
jgi:hypothetical protein